MGLCADANAPFNLGGLVLSTLGFLLVGMSVFQTIDVSISSKGVTAKLDQIAKNVAQVQNQNAVATQTLTDLSAKVNEINDKLVISSANHLSDSEQTKLANIFNGYQTYLHDIGYKAASSSNVRVKFENSSVPNASSYFDPDTSTVFIAEDDTKHPNYVQSILSEYMHKVLYSSINSGDKYDGRWEDVITWVVLEFALTSYFPGSFMNVSGVYMDVDSWDMNNTLPFSHRGECRNVACERNRPWAGAFWDIRGQLGQKIFDKILFSVWNQLKPEDVQKGDGAPFVLNLMAAEGGKYSKIMRDVFARRGLTNLSK